MKDRGQTIKQAYKGKKGGMEKRCCKKLTRERGKGDLGLQEEAVEEI